MLSIARDNHTLRVKKNDFSHFAEERFTIGGQWSGETAEIRTEPEF